jgi:hypothetical protein
MASLEDNLNTLLSDPNAMEQIFSLAGKLGMNSDRPADLETPEASSQENTSAPETPQTTASQPLLGPEALGQIGKLFELFQTSQQTSQEADALLDALRPFLRQEQQEKLDRARRLAGLSHAARQVYRLWKEGVLHV